MRETRSPASAQLGELIRDLRHKTTMSRRTLAELADMDISHIARLEGGIGNPTMFALIQLATVFGVSPGYFVEGLTAADLPEHIRPLSQTDVVREMRRREELDSV